MLLVRSPLPSSTTFSPCLYLAHTTPKSSRPATPTESSIPLRSPIFLSSASLHPNTPRKRHLSITIDVQTPVDQSNNTQRPFKKFCNRSDILPVLTEDIGQNNGAEEVSKGVNNRSSDCKKGVINSLGTPLPSFTTKKLAKMDIDMGSDNGMSGGVINIQLQPFRVNPSPSLPALASRPKLGRLDTSTSLNFEPGLTISAYPSSSSINEMSTSPAKPSTSLPQVMQLKRNPKKLSLNLPSLTSSASSSPNCSTPSTVCPTPTFSNAESDSKFGTPYTPGPPKTPALAMSLGRSTFHGNRRPSLLSLITNPPGNDDQPPPTPGLGGNSLHPYATMRLKTKGRARSHTAAEVLGLPEQQDRTSSSSFGTTTFPPITESNTVTNYDQTSGGLSSLGYALPTTASPQSQSRSYDSSSPTTSTSTESDAASSSSTPSTSPPLPTAFTFAMPLNDYYQYPAQRQMEPYEDGPIQILPGIFLGTEESVFQFDSYASSGSKVRIINVAQEVDDPFDPSSSISVPGWSNMGKEKGKEKMKLTTYPTIISQDGSSSRRPEIEYCHIRWSHGELGLADLPDLANLTDILDPNPCQSNGIDQIWGFWETIKWMENGRRNGIPILIHCQCGVSRSATLAIAYTMALAAIGAMPDILGGIRSMQDAYDFVKAKSSWIGPNHSLVFQLVDFARHLTYLLSLHLSSSPDVKPIKTSFPTNRDSELSEAEWARRRKEFEESENGSCTSSSSGDGSKEVECCISPEEADEEARRLDEEMLLRKARR